MPKVIRVRKVDGKPGSVYYPLDLAEVESRLPAQNQVRIQMTAAALNHRDLFIRQQLYPGVSFEVPLGADGCGIVTATGDSADAKRWLGKRVVINPGTGWKDHPAGPEDKAGYRILGGTKVNPGGTFVEEFVVDIGELEEAPSHLSDHEAAALPLTGLTAWRASHIKAREAMQPGKNVLITGIGGGVAIMALLFAVASGANVYVSSGNEEKIQKAVKLGAKGGVNYKDKAWDKKLIELLPKDHNKLDAIVDGAGADIVEKGSKLLVAGGVISVYGMTTSPKMPFIMPAVLKNIEVRGSTMGSRKEFHEMVEFVNKHNLKPIVSKVAKGLSNISEVDGLFDEMKNSSQFGKLVIEIAGEGQKRNFRL